jgi:hypothetical protein
MKNNNTRWLKDKELRKGNRSLESVIVYYGPVNTCINVKIWS